MSELKVNSIKGTGASTAAITIDSSSGGCRANVTNNLTNRNLIINGAMQVAQRGTSSSSTGGGYHTVDRILTSFSGHDEALTISQSDVASGTTPYTNGFRKALKFLNGNQTSGAGAADFAQMQYRFEAQDIANSGWNYLSSSSFITLSFWVKSSVAQNFYGTFRSIDGTERGYPFETGSLTADTWTKITKTIPGNSGLQFDNDANQGLQLIFAPFFGTDYTGTVTLNQWNTYSSSARTPNNTSTWWTTNDSTWEITGMQLEVGSVATDFEHRTFGQELQLCKRYYQEYKNIQMSGYIPDNNARAYGLGFNFPVEMRAAPTLTISNTGSSSGQTISTGDLNANITSLLSQGTTTYNAEINVNVSQDLTDNRPAVASSAGYSVRQTKYMFNGEL